MPKIQRNENKPTPTGLSKRLLIVLVASSVFFVVSLMAVIIKIAGQSPKSAIAKAYESCTPDYSAYSEKDVVIANISAGVDSTKDYVRLLSDDAILVRGQTSGDDVMKKKDEMICILEELGGIGAYSDVIGRIRDTDVMEEFEFGEYIGLLRLYVGGSLEESETTFTLSVYTRGDDILTITENVCNVMYEDRGEPVKERYEYDSWSDYNMAKSAYRTYGELKLTDNGDTLIFNKGSSDLSGKEECIFSMVGLPDRIKNSTKSGKEEWGDFAIDWSSANKFLIYKK